MSRNDVLVTAEWAETNLDNPNVVFVEVDEDTNAYDGGRKKWELDGRPGFHCALSSPGESTICVRGR